MYKLLPALFLCLSALALCAQPAERRPGDLIIQLQGDADLESALNWLRQDAGVEVFVRRTLAPEWRMYLIGFDETADNAEPLIAAARRLPGIRFAQWNHRAAERATPNDPEWWRQSALTLIGAPEAWDAATGGLTPMGDTIVVAVLENGAAGRDHPDLQPNMFFNWHDKAGDGIDNDGNGYVDDFLGWNVRNESDDLGPLGQHATSVNGIIGAAGNNNLGVSGVNWSVKLLTLSNVEYEDEIIAAYRYVAAMRRLYATSNRTKGAFVVATNASFGISNANPANFPVWCSLYDSLGVLGIVSVAATANAPVDVDVKGDMPTGCPSDYLITVTNVNNVDALVNNAGYGKTTIDLGAPGDNTYTVRLPPQNYGSFGGTSAACPHVAGAVGLLYSMGCTALTADAHTQPEQCARRIRTVILENTEPNASLQGKTVTNGRLSLARATNAVRELCDGSVGPLDITLVRPNPVRDELQVFYETPAFNAYNLRVFNMLGQLMLERTVQPEQFAEKLVKIPTTDLPAGVYSVVFGRGEVFVSRKFVKM